MWLRTRCALLVIMCLIGSSSCSSICEVACALSGRNPAFHVIHSSSRETGLNREPASGMHLHCGGPVSIGPVDPCTRVIRIASTCVGSCCQPRAACLYPKKDFDRTNRFGPNQTLAVTSWESPLTSAIIGACRERSRACLPSPASTSLTLRI